MKAHKIFLLVATGLLTVAGSTAFANDKWLGNRGDNWEQHITSTKTRAQVIAELNDARALGLVGYGQVTAYPSAPVVKSARTRDEVRAEAEEAAKNPKRTIEYSSGR
jgi:hypothetical protein